MSKILITSGCSFSAVNSTSHPDVWPRPLFERLKKYGFTESKSSARISQGNGLISRGVIYDVTQALKKYDASDILVGVMWSGADRADFRCEDPNLIYDPDCLNNFKAPICSVVPDASNNWVILNAHWANHGNKEALLHYKHFYSVMGAQIQTLEHILRTQWFLKTHRIKYFFTKFQDITFDEACAEYAETKHLYDLLDFDYFLPGKSQYTWMLDNNIPNLYPEEYPVRHPANHPGTRSNLDYVDKLIMPWLQTKRFI